MLVRLFVLLCLPTLLFAQGSSLDFKKRAPVVGELRIVAQRSESISKSEREIGDQGAQKTSRSTKSWSKRSYRVLATTADQVTRVKVTYHEIERETKSEGGQERPNRRQRRRPRDEQAAEPVASADQLVGKNFTIVLDGDEPKVLDSKGAAADPSLARAVLRREVRDGRLSGWGLSALDALGVGQRQIGESFTLKGDKATSLFGGGGAARRGGGRRGGGGRTSLEADLVLRDKTSMLGRACARFDFELRMIRAPREAAGEGEGRRRRARGGPAADRSMKGEIWVDLSSLTVVKMKLIQKSEFDREFERQDTKIRMSMQSRSAMQMMTVIDTSAAKAKTPRS